MSVLQEYQPVKQMEVADENTVFGHCGRGGHPGHVLLLRKLQARKEGDASFYSKLARKFEELGLASWDGFSKSASGVLDGTMFSFEAEMRDGSRISARGSNAFPQNYGAFTDYLWNLVHS